MYRASPLSRNLLPPLIEGATYSHYPVRVENRSSWLAASRKEGLELGKVIEYSIPEVPAYSKYVDRDFRNSTVVKQSILNLPVHARMRDSNKQRVVTTLRTKGQLLGATHALGVRQ